MLAPLAALVMLGAAHSNWWVVESISLEDDVLRRGVALHFTPDGVDVVAKGALDERLGCTTDDVNITCGTRQLTFKPDGDKATLGSGFRGVGQVLTATLRPAKVGEVEAWDKLVASAPSIEDACAQAHACAVQGRKKAKITDVRDEVGKGATWKRCMDARRALVSAIQARKKVVPAACREPHAK